MPDVALLPLVTPGTINPLIDLSPLEGMSATSLKIVESFNVPGGELNTKGYRRVVYDRRNDVYVTVSLTSNTLYVVDRSTKLVRCSFLLDYRGCGATNDDDVIADILIHSSLVKKPPVEDYYYKTEPASPPAGGQQPQNPEEGASSETQETINEVVTEAVLDSACDTAFYAASEGTITLEGTGDPKDTLREEIEVSLLIVNDVQRTANILRVNLDITQRPTTVDSTGSDPIAILNANDVVSFIELLPKGAAWDELACPTREKVFTYTVPAHTKTYYTQYPLVEAIMPAVKEHIYVGKFEHRYCGFACTETGRYFVLLGSRVKCWLTPFLDFPIFTQYLLSIDDAALDLTWTYVGPMEKAFVWDETDRGQPFYHSPAIYDGRRLIMQHDIKSRHIGLKQTSEGMVNSTNQLLDTPGTPDPIRFIGEQDWAGGYVANIMYPMRAAFTEWTNLGGTQNKRWYGYADTWDNETVDKGLEPIFREAEWVSIDINEINRHLSADTFHSLLRTQRVSRYVDEESFDAPISIQGNDIIYAFGPQIVHCNMNYLVFFEEGPGGVRHPLDSLYFPGVVPGESVQKTFKIRNISEHGMATHLKLCMDAGEIPIGVTVSVSGFPDELLPQEEAFFTLKLTYFAANAADCVNCPCADTKPTPPTGEEDNVYLCCNCVYKENAKPLPSIDIPLGMQYFMVWDLSSYLESMDKMLASKQDHVRLTDDLTSLKAVEDFQFDVPYEFMYSLFESAGDYAYKPQARSMWVVNKSDITAYDVSLNITKASTPTHGDTGFFIIDYPKGNVVKPGAAIPAVIHWVPNVAVGMNNIVSIDTPQALATTIASMNLFSASAVASYRTKSVDNPIDGTNWSEYGGGQVVHISDVDVMPLIPLSYNSDPVLRRLVPCDSAGAEVDFWRAPLDTFYPQNSWFTLLTDSTERFVEMPVYVKNTATEPMECTIDLIKSMSHPLFPLVDILYPAGNIVPAGGQLMLTAVLKVYGTFARLGHMNLKRDVILVPVIKARRM